MATLHHYRRRLQTIIKFTLVPTLFLYWITASAAPLTKAPGTAGVAPSSGTSTLGALAQCQTPPVLESFGLGIAGQNGAPHLALNTLPLLNISTLELEVTGGPAFARAELLVSESEGSLGGFNLGLQPWKNFSFFLDQLGEAKLPTAHLSLNNPALCGKLFIVQVGIEDATANGGIAITNALRVRFGSTAQFAPIVNPVSSPTAATSVTLTGQGTQPSNKIVVEGGANTVDTILGSSGTFSIDVQLTPNSLNKLFVYEVGGDGVKGTPATVAIMHDNEAPVLIVDFPAEGAKLTGTTFEVGGKVGDALSGTNGMQVFIDGAPALVNPGIGINGTFFLPGIPLNPSSPTSIEVVAQDILGNGRSTVITVHKLQAPAGSATIEIISGNNQSAKVGTTLPQPIKVKLKKADGNPLADKVVSFIVAKSNGKLGIDGAGQGVVNYQVMTDSGGFAQAFWSIGDDAGEGNNRVDAVAVGVLGTASFFASATANSPSRIVSSSGMNQQAAFEAPLPNPLRVWVSDSTNNGIGNIPVTFEVKDGDGHFNGENQITVLTDVTGHADVPFIMGKAELSSRVEATFTGNLGLPAAFVATAVRSISFQKTSLTTIVQSNGGQPLVGARATLKIGDTVLGPVFSDSHGIINFPNILGSGPALLDVDGSTVIQVGTAPGVNVPVGSYPALNFSIVLVEHADNTLPTPVIFPPLDPANAVLFDNTKDVTLTVKSLPGLKMFVKKGSVYRKNGLPPSVEDPVILSLDQVQVEDVPLLMPDGIASPFAWTLQPYGLYFSPPISIEMPNMSALEPGTAVYFTSFNHDTSSFEVAGVGGVSADGSVVRTDPGTGVDYSGWGGVSATPTVSGGVQGDCAPTSNGCGSGWTDIFVPNKVLSGKCDFTAPCDAHDVCWGTCGNQKVICDTAFRGELLLKCAQCAPGTGDAAKACALLADLYATQVEDDPFGIYCDSQEDNCSCQEEALPQECNSESANLSSFMGKLGENISAQDEDHDFMDDQWEISFGLNPADHNDGAKDPDGDALPNYLEFIHQNDPYDPDTDKNSIDDGAQATAAQLPLPLGIDESWDLSLNGQHVKPTVFGTFNFPNVVVPDIFGATGQGSPSDGMSDIKYRVNGVSTKYGSTRYMRSGCFNIIGGQSVTTGNFEYSYTPFPELDSIALALDAETLTQIDQETDLHIIGTFSDGSSKTLGTSDVCNITYISSNPAIASIATDGTVTAHAAGLVYITVRAEGATSTIALLVSPGSLITTLQGFVVTPAGAAVVGATIKTEVGLTATSAANGSFTINAYPVNGAVITITAEATISGNKVSGASFKKMPLPGGFTDMGLIVVDADTDADGLNNWYETNVSGTATNDADSDDDGLSDALEVLQYDTDPTSSDTDGDGILDGAEILFGLDPLSSDFTSTLQGHVTLPGGEIAAGAKVRVTGETVNFYKTTTDSSGAFSISAWPATIPASVVVIHTFQNQPLTTQAGPRTPVIGVTDFGTLTLAPITIGKPLFSGTQIYMPNTSAPVGLVIADFNEDQIPDVATANKDLDSLSIALGKGGGSFTPATSIANAGDEPRDLVSADFNNDGHADIVLINRTGDLAKFYSGLGNGQFNTAVNISIPVRGSILGIQIVDVDHDLQKDLVVLSSSGKLATILSSGLGAFSPSVTTPAIGGTTPTFFTVTDATGDGIQDILIAFQSENRISILPGLATGGFGTFITFGSAKGVTGPVEARSGDFNSDGIPDLVMSGAQSKLMLGQGSGLFGNATTITGGQNLSGLAVGRLNGDTKDDIVALRTSGSLLNNTVKFFGKGDSSFEPALAFGTGISLNKILIAEADGDTFTDIVSLSLGGAVTVARGDGTGNFLGTEQEFVAVTTAPQLQSKFGDMNKDGIEDIITFGAANPVTYLGKADGTFESGIVSPLGGQLSATRIGDLNNDSIPDIIVATSGAPFIFQLQTQIALGQANGSFVPLDAGLTLGGNLRTPFPIDIDGDGRLDLLVTSVDTAQLIILRGIGNGTFAPALVVPFIAGSIIHQVADANHDGKLDIFFSTGTGGVGGTATWGISYGTGGFTFSSAKSFLPSVPSISTGFAANDLDLDGNIDVVFSGAPLFSPALAYVYYGKSNSDFESGSLLPLSPGVVSTTPIIADINADQLPDILSPGGGGITILLNRGERSFHAPWAYGGSGGTAPLLTDRNGDGHLDVISSINTTGLKGFSIMNQLP